MSNFDKWMRDIDLELLATCGMTTSDLADQCYRDWFDDGLTAREAAELALEDEGFDIDLLG